MTASFIGTWRLASYLAIDSAGRARTVWGDHPLGQLVYTADGHMSAHVYDERRAPLGEDVESASADHVRPLYLGGASYFGTYSVDTAAHRAIHTVEGAWLPDWIGSRQERSYRFVGDDQLELSVPGDALLWQRVSRQ